MSTKTNTFEVPSMQPVGFSDEKAIEQTSERVVYLPKD